MMLSKKQLEALEEYAKTRVYNVSSLFLVRLSGRLVSFGNKPGYSSPGMALSAFKSLLKDLLVTRSFERHAPLYPFLEPLRPYIDEDASKTTKTAEALIKAFLDSGILTVEKIS